MISNLNDSPAKREETIALIEAAFDYDQKNSFATDFYPLMAKENSKNNYLFLDQGVVVAHVGVLYKELSIGGQIFELAMLGGIAVDAKFQGQGHFRNLFTKVVEQINSPISLLWSDKLDLYKKFDFYPTIEQNEYVEQESKGPLNFRKTKLSDLSRPDLEQLSALYNNASELRPNRSIEDWELLKNIRSTNLYVKGSPNIENYFFMDKGEDLQGVILEYGHLDDYEEILNHGILWTPRELKSQLLCQKQYAALMKITNQARFVEFIKAYTQGQINITEIKKGRVSFTFAKETHSDSIADFLGGVFGPNSYKELEDLRPIFLSGLDSI